MDVLAFGAPLVRLTDGPGRVPSGQQQKPISSDCAGHNDGGDEQPLAALEVQPFGRTVDLVSDGNTWNFEKIWNKYPRSIRIRESESYPRRDRGNTGEGNGQRCTSSTWSPTSGWERRRPTEDESIAVSSTDSFSMFWRPVRWKSGRRRTRRPTWPSSVRMAFRVPSRRWIDTGKSPGGWPSSCKWLPFREPTSKDGLRASTCCQIR